MSSNKLKYKLGTVEIIAFIVAVLVMVGVSRISSFIESSDQNKVVIFVAILTFFSSMYGAVIGGLAGFLGVVCCYALDGGQILFGNALAMTAYGALVGQFAPKYMVRDGAFRRKQVGLFVISEATACIVALVFVNPLCDFVIYNKSLIDSVSLGMNNSLICMVPLNICMAVLLYIVSIFYKSENG